MDYIWAEGVRSQEKKKKIRILEYPSALRLASEAKKSDSASGTIGKGFFIKGVFSPSLFSGLTLL